MLDTVPTNGPTETHDLAVAGTVCKIPLAKIRPNPENPRETFDQKKVKELADSIQAAGRLNQAIGVRYLPDEETGTDYEIVWGGRRFLAHELLAKKDKRWSEIDAVIMDGKVMSELDRDIAAGVENLARVDLSIMEEARYYQRMKEKHGFSVAKIAKACGVPQFRVKWRLSLLKLEPEIQKLIETDQLPAGHALEIAKVPPADQRRLIKRYAEGKLERIETVRAAVETILNKDVQTEMDTGRPASTEEVTVLNRMEQRIARFAELSQTGWKDGECMIASKVNPDRALTMADQLKAICASLKEMERQLRKAHARRETVATQEELVAA